MKTATRISWEETSEDKEPREIFAFGQLGNWIFSSQYRGEIRSFPEQTRPDWVEEANRRWLASHGDPNTGGTGGSGTGGTGGRGTGGTGGGGSGTGGTGNTRGTGTGQGDGTGGTGTPGSAIQT